MKPKTFWLRTLAAVRDDSGVTALLISAAIAAIAFVGLSAVLRESVGLRGLTERTTTQADKMPKIVAALHAFAVANERLPCPARSATNGNEQASCTSATVARGLLPWSTLGLARNDVLDSTGQRFFTYGVTAVAAGMACPSTMPTNPALFVTLNTDGDAGHTGDTTNRYLAIIVAHGENGAGATLSSGAAGSTPANVSEAENIPAATPERVFGSVATNIVGDDTSAAYYDDMVRLIEFGTGSNQIQFCEDVPAVASLEYSGYSANTDADGFSGSGTEADPYTKDVQVKDAGGSDVSGALETVTLGGSGTIVIDGTDDTIGVSDDFVDPGETLLVEFENRWRQFSTRLELVDGADDEDRKVTVTGLLGNTIIGTRVLPGADEDEHVYMTLGFGGAEFNKLRFTIEEAADPLDSARFQLYEFTVCGGELFPCELDDGYDDGDDEWVAMPQAVFRVDTDEDDETAVTFGQSGEDDDDFELNADILCPCEYETIGGRIAAVGDIEDGTDTEGLAIIDGTTDDLTEDENFFREDSAAATLTNIVDLVNVGGDVYFHATYGGTNNNRVYRALASSATPYQPQRVRTSAGGGQDLIACGAGANAIIGVGDTAFFEAYPANLTAAECGLWRMRRSNSTATQVLLRTGVANNYLVGTNNSYFVGQDRLFVVETLDNGTAQGVQLHRVSPSGAVTEFDLDSGTADANPSQFSLIEDVVFFTAANGGVNQLRYIDGGTSATAGTVNLSAAGGDNPAQNPGYVVATIDGDDAVRYYVRADRAGNDEIFSFTDVTGSGTGCLGWDSGETIQPIIAANGGTVYWKGSWDGSGPDGNYMFQADEADLDDDGGCTTGAGGTIIGAPASSGVAPDPDLTSLWLINDSDDDGGFYVQGEADLPSDPAGTELFIADRQENTLRDISGDGMDGPPEVAGLIVINGVAYFSALNTDRRFYTHDPGDSDSGAVDMDDDAIDDHEDPESFTPFDTSPTSKLSSP